MTDQVTDIAPIRVSNALRVLECRGSGINNGLLADLTPLKGMNLARLTRLDLKHTKVTDAGMIDSKDCKDLRYLDLTNTKVTDRGLAHFQDCKDLTELHVTRTQVGDAGLAHFKDCRALTHLSLAQTKVSDVGLARFEDCKNLTFLHLDQTQVGDAGLANFKDCKNLSRLYVNMPRVSDAGLANFKGMPLRVVWIDNTGITDLTPLQGMPLEEICLTPKNISRGLDMLRDMKSLKTIGIGYKQAWPAAEFWQHYDKGEFTK